jgi:hypothetical protein
MKKLCGELTFEDDQRGIGVDSITDSIFCNAFVVGIVPAGFNWLDPQ